MDRLHLSMALDWENAAVIKFQPIGVLEGAAFAAPFSNSCDFKRSNWRQLVSNGEKGIRINKSM